MALFIAYNGAAPTTAGLPKVTTGTVIKTLLQLATPATQTIEIMEWGIDFDGSAAGTPIQTELIQTDVAATVTAHVAAGLMNIRPVTSANSVLTLGTAATGFTATAEGTITATRLFQSRLIAPTSNYTYEWADGRMPEVAVSRFCRIRVTAPAAVNATCFIKWRE